MAIRNKARWALASASTLSLALFVGPALAQETADNMQLETVTVTGVKGFGTDVTQVGSFRGAKLIDTPMTIQVLPHDLLESQQAQNLNDALRNIAGVNNSQTSTVVTSGQSVRGIALDNRNAYRGQGASRIDEGRFGAVLRLCLARRRGQSDHEATDCRHHDRDGRLRQ